jgi:hypothetical protein
MRRAGLIITVLVVLSIVGCRTNHMPVANPNAADLTAQQKSKLAEKKLHVPCRVEVQCPNSLVGDDSSFFTSLFNHHFYYYPLQDILTNSFSNAMYSVFDQPKGEIIDSFNLYITVPESRLNISGGDAEYYLHLIVKFTEPGEKKITAFGVKVHLEKPMGNENEIPPVVYEVARDAAYKTLKKLTKSPRVLRTVSRFEDR